MLGDIFILKQTNRFNFQTTNVPYFPYFLFITRRPGEGGIYFTEGNICHIGPIKILDLSIFEFFTKVENNIYRFDAMPFSLYAVNKSLII